MADEQLSAAVAQGLLRPQMSDVLPMSSCAEGLQRIAGRRATARLVLLVKEFPARPADLLEPSL